MEKTALFVMDDELLVNILKLIFKEIDYEVQAVKTPKEAIENVTKEVFYIVVIGKNESTIVKSRLADIIYEKALKPKPHIIIVREPGDMIYKADYITTIKHPTFHQELLKSISLIDENKKIKQILYGSKQIVDNFIKSDEFSQTTPSEFFKNMKGNQKFEIRAENKRMIGFVMSGEIYVLFSDFQDPYGTFTLDSIEAVKEDLKIPEFLSLQLGNNVFKINFKEFIYKSLERIYDKDKLLSFVPSVDKTIEVKAPSYILEQCSFIKNNFDIKWLESKSEDITFEEILKENKYDLSKVRALVAMYILGIIELSKEGSTVNTQFDVKIKKSFLKKIIDKIRGL